MPWPNCLLFASHLFNPKLSSLFNSSKLKAFDLFDPIAGWNVKQPGKLHRGGAGMVVSYLLQALHHTIALTMDPVMRYIY